MEQIKMIFYALVSFFAIEDGRIGADKTTVTVSPEKQEITIIQEALFTVIESKQDSVFVIKQWESLVHKKENKMLWTKEMDCFSNKKITFVKVANAYQPHLSFNYKEEKDLWALGIRYNADKNQFSINEIPQYNIKTEQGTLEGNYWVFQGDSTFVFTMEPFLQMPERYQQYKKPLEALFIENKK